MKKFKLLFLLVVSILISAVPNSIKADEIKNEIEKGSITVRLSDTEENRNKSNVKFSINKVANIVDGKYVNIPELIDFVDFNKIENAEDLEKASNLLVNKVSNKGIIFETNSEGIFVADDLDVGLYLLHCVDNAEYDNVMPTLVSIPMFDGVTKQMNFHIEVNPKHQPLTNIHVNKVDSYTLKNIISKNFEFGLYSDDECKNLIKKAEVDVSQGLAKFEDLPYGIYYIKELKAPDGYRLSKDIVKVAINKNGIDVENKNVIQNKNTYSFIYENQLLGTVQTGDTSHVGLFTIGLLISGITILIIYKKSRKDFNTL